MASRTTEVETSTPTADATRDRRSRSGVPPHEGHFSVPIIGGLDEPSVLAAVSETSITLYTVPVVGVELAQTGVTAFGILRILIPLMGSGSFLSSELALFSLSAHQIDVMVERGCVARGRSGPGCLPIRAVPFGVSRDWEEFRYGIDSNSYRVSSYPVMVSPPARASPRIPSVSETSSGPPSSA
jgi:hypothetical protein